MPSMYDTGNATSWGFMFDIICNEQKYSPLPGQTVLDLGAHYGFFSLFCATRGALVTAYEPDTENFEYLEDARQRAIDLGFPNGLEIHNQGVWSSTRTLNLCREHHSGTSNVCNLGTFRQAVPMVSFEVAIAGKDWDCVKMDIEGAEFEVLLTARHEDLKRIKYLSLELHNHIGENPQPRYEALMQVLNNFYDVEPLEKRDGRFCKAFCTLKR